MQARCQDSVPAARETRGVGGCGNGCLLLGSRWGCGRPGPWCQLWETLGSQHQLLEQVGSLTSSHGAGTVHVPKPAAGGTRAPHQRGDPHRWPRGPGVGCSGGRVSVSSPNQVCTHVCVFTSKLSAGPGSLRSRYQAGGGSVLVRPGGLANVVCMRDECVSGYEAFSASVCLQTEHEMGFTFGYSENTGQQSVLWCLL